MRIVTVIKTCSLTFICLAFSAAAAFTQPTADPTVDTVQRGGSSEGSASTGANAIDFVAGSGSCGTNSEQTIGWQFDVLNSVTVLAMAWFDEGGDGLQLAHEVGIWDPGGTLIESTHLTIPAGTTATLDGIWRIVKITPTELVPGESYIVGGYNGSQHTECISFNVEQTVQPDLNYVDATFARITGLFERPTSFAAAFNGIYGVGFQIGGSPVPTVSKSGGLLMAVILVTVSTAVLVWRRRVLLSRISSNV